MIRVAFLTPEFVTEYQTGGGLGTYVDRMTRALTDCGHRCEVFVFSQAEPTTIDHNGVLVHRVRHLSRSAAFQVAWRTPALPRLQVFRCSTLDLVAGAMAMADALEIRERTHPFNLVQSADFQAVGLFVGQRPTRPHVIRCSAAWDLWTQCDRQWNSQAKTQALLERLSMRRADFAYAPSELIANHFRAAHGLAVGVVRPPAPVETAADARIPHALPERFFIHFGQLRRRKGTMVLAAALPKVWAAEPGFQMVWAGNGRRRELRQMRHTWGTFAPNVQFLGPVPRATLVAILRRAQAAVLPSLVDNLPNTVIESLNCGIPVIGSRGASIDELVQDGITGELVPPDDPDALAQSLIRWWRGQVSVQKGFVWNSPLAIQMQPATAVQELLRFAGGVALAGGRDDASGMGERGGGSGRC